MWTKQQTQVEEPVSSRPPAQVSAITPFTSPSPARLSGSNTRNIARLGSSLEIKGQITGSEDLQIDGTVEGPISLHGHELIVGSTAQLHSEIHAGDVVAYGKIVGNIHARGRVDIKKDGSIIGDISSARISVEDGAHFRGRIEIDPAKSQAAAD